MAVAVALATYPIIRKLTRRLELLQRGVELVQDWWLSDLQSNLKLLLCNELLHKISHFFRSDKGLHLQSGESGDLYSLQIQMGYR